MPARKELWPNLSWQKLNLRNAECWGVHNTHGEFIPMTDCSLCEEIFFCPISPGVPRTSDLPSFLSDSLWKGHLHLLCSHPWNTGHGNKVSPKPSFPKAIPPQFSQLFCYSWLPNPLITLLTLLWTSPARHICFTWWGAKLNIAFQVWNTDKWDNDIFIFAGDALVGATQNPAAFLFMLCWNIVGTLSCRFCSLNHGNEND